MMSESDEYRIWTLREKVGIEYAQVQINEAKNCDLADDLLVGQRKEKISSGQKGAVLHIVSVPLTRGGDCRVVIKYWTGDRDVLRESERLARYRFYICRYGSCRVPIL